MVVNVSQIITNDGLTMYVMQITGMGAAHSSNYSSRYSHKHKQEC